DADVAQRVETGRIQPMQIQRMCPECEEEQALQMQPEEEEEELQAKFADEHMQRQPIEEEDEEMQAKEVPGKAPQVGSGVESRINSLKGGGQPLDPATRSFFEPRFGHDFSGVRVNSGGNASEAAKSVNARAFTLGSNMVFGSGQYQPESAEGKRLLGHELTHVVQQKQSGEIKRIQTFQLPLPKSSGLPDIYIEPIPHTHPLIPCVPIPVTHIGVTVRRKGPLSTGKGKIIANLHIGVYRDLATGRACFVMFESHATKLCLIFCFPTWNDMKRAWRWLRDKIAKGLKYILAALGIVVAAWIIYLIASAIATVLMALPVLALA
ncbi:MAG: DUF4157 domain-containing protein, partial [Gallionellaceae bacterium]